MFNPEGVKGRTAQPPHNFYKIMKYFFDVTVSVMDANTRIELYEFSEPHISAHGPLDRAKTSAKRKAIRAAMDSIHRDWRESIYTQYCVFGNHGLTAKQLWWLVDEGLIVEPNDKVVEVKTCECTGWMS